MAWVLKNIKEYIYDVRRGGLSTGSAGNISVHRLQGEGDPFLNRFGTIVFEQGTRGGEVEGGRVDMWGGECV